MLLCYHRDRLLSVKCLSTRPTGSPGLTRHTTTIKRQKLVATSWAARLSSWPRSTIGYSILQFCGSNELVKGGHRPDKFRTGHLVSAQKAIIRPYNKPSGLSWSVCTVKLSIHKQLHESDLVQLPTNPEILEHSIATRTKYWYNCSSTTELYNSTTDPML